MKEKIYTFYGNSKTCTDTEKWFIEFFWEEEFNRRVKGWDLVLK